MCRISGGVAGLLSHLSNLCKFVLRVSYGQRWTISHFEITAKKNVTHGQDRQSTELPGDPVVPKDTRTSHYLTSMFLPTSPVVFWSSSLIIREARLVSWLSKSTCYVEERSWVRTCLVISVFLLPGIPSVKKFCSQPFHNEGLACETGFPVHLERGAALES